MKITVIAVGKIKERFFEEAIAEYSKRLSRYCRLEIIQVADEKTPDRASEAVERQIKDKEGERILSHVKDSAYVIALAEKINSLGLSGESHIQLVIGGSLGLSKKVMDRADFALSFSKMTFPHQLMRVVLLEQIYRSFRIIEGAPYHK